VAIRFLKQLAVARCFDLLHNSNLTVPMYADRFKLFVFGAPLPSDRPESLLCKGGVIKFKKTCHSELTSVSVRIRYQRVLRIATHLRCSQ